MHGDKEPSGYIYFAGLPIGCQHKIYIHAEISLELSEDVEVGMIWGELLTTSKHLCSTHLKIKGICSLKGLKFKRLQYTGENTAMPPI